MDINLLSLPDELLLKIISYFEIPSVYFHISQINMRFHNLCRGNSLWAFIHVPKIGRSWTLDSVETEWETAVLKKHDLAGRIKSSRIYSPPEPTYAAGHCACDFPLCDMTCYCRLPDYFGFWTFDMASKIFAMAGQGLRTLILQDRTDSNALIINAIKTCPNLETLHIYNCKV